MVIGAETTGDAFAGRLLAGERILWSGRPAGGLLLMPRDVFVIPFSLLWCGFAIFWETSVARTNAPWFFMLWGGMFVCIGLYFVFGRFFFDAWVRRDMRYALTDRRILIARRRPRASFTAVRLDQLPEAQLTERGDGRGTIRFGQPAALFSNQVASWSPALDTVPQFLAIEDARRVFDLVQGTRG